MDALKRLEEIGFRRVGSWEPASDGIVFQCDDNLEKINVLYAFVSDRQVLYVGKTVKSIVKRLAGYQRPGTSQRTNRTCNNLISKQLARNLPVEVFVRPQQKVWRIGSFAVSEAAALEDAIIRELCPPWNRMGK
jgi:hypothetical protein